MIRPWRWVDRSKSPGLNWKSLSLAVLVVFGMFGVCWGTIYGLITLLQSLGAEVILYCICGVAIAGMLYYDIRKVYRIMEMRRLDREMPND